jgi:hypothetical protein
MHAMVFVAFVIPRLRVLSLSVGAKLVLDDRKSEPEKR